MTTTPMTEQEIEEARELADDDATPGVLALAMADLIAEVARLRAELGHVEPAEEPASGGLCNADNAICECCGKRIARGAPVAVWRDGDRWVLMHWGQCPPPDLWRIEWKPRASTRWTSPSGWIRARDIGGVDLAEPYEDAVLLGRRVARSKTVERVRLVRVKEQGR